MEIYGKTDIGKKRVSNQDAFKSEIVSEETAWTIVCDGMGGAYGGDIASRMAVDFIAEKLNLQLKAIKDGTCVKKIMEDAICGANKAIFEKASKDKSVKGMGTTVVLVVVHDSVAHIMHVGDSRAYFVNAMEIRQVGEDHSVIQEMINHGEITASEAKNHAQKNIITRALGVCEDVKIDYNLLELKKEDIIFSCTDGVVNHLGDEEIHKCFSFQKISNVPEKIVNECNARGGKDNITVAVLKL